MSVLTANAAKKLSNKNVKGEYKTKDFWRNIINPHIEEEAKKGCRHTYVYLTHDYIKQYNTSIKDILLYGSNDLGFNVDKALECHNGISLYIDW